MRTVIKQLTSLGAMACLAGCSTPAPPLAPVVIDPPNAVSPHQPPPAPRPLTVEDAVRRAIICNRQLEALQAAVQVAEQQRHAATDITDPELGVAWGRNVSDELRYRSGSRNTVSDSRTIGGDAESTRNRETSSTMTTGSARDSGNGWKMSGRFFIPNPWLLGPRLEATRAETQAAQADVQAAKWWIECEVRRLFSEINYLSRDMAIAEEIGRLNRNIAKVVQSRSEQGAATLSDALTATRRHLMAQDSLDRICQDYKVAQRGLAALLNVPIATLRIDTNMPACSLPLNAPVSPDWAEGVALRRRGDVAALRWRSQAAHAAYREARNVRVPWIKEINASYRSSTGHSWGTDTITGSSYGSSISQSDNGSDQSRSRRTEYAVTERYSEEDGEEWWVGFAVDIPIFSLGKNHADRVLLAQYNLARTNETEGMRLASREVYDALDELEESRRQQARYENDVAPLIAEMQRTLATLKSTPDAMPDQVAAMELQIIESMRLDLGARWRYHLAIIALDRAVGAPLSELPKP